MNTVTVYTGPMKCGKTNNLIQDYNKLIHSNYKCGMFKPSIDNRFNVDAVTNRDNNSIKAININTLTDLYLYKDKYDIFFIDEFQFINGSINTLLDLRDQGKMFYIAGLNLTAERKPFGIINDALCIADKIVVLSGICDICKTAPSIYTFCTEHKNTDILVGENMYITVCSDCYNTLSRHTN